MSEVIYKYHLSFFKEQTISLPIDAKILTVAMQGDSMYMWASHHFPKQAYHSSTMYDWRTIFIIATGEEVPNLPTKYIGTVFAKGFVWHVYEK